MTSVTFQTNRTEAAAAAVYVADTLDGPFLPVEGADLDLERLSITLGQSIDEARFTLSYGESVRRRSSTAYELVTAQDLVDRFVRVDFEGRRWYGVFVDDSRDRHGSYGLGATIAGTQVVTALGLEHLLRTVVVTSSYVRGSTEFQIGRGLVFNGDENGATFGNLSAGLPPVTILSPMFEASRDRGTPWSARNAIEYLLTRFPPRDGTGAPVGTWRLSADADSVIGWMEQTVPTDGRTVFDLVEAFVDRRRGLSWHVEFDEASGVVELRPVSLLAQPVNLPGVGTIPSNVSPVAVDFEGAADVNAEVRLTQLTRFDRVVVRGARKTTTCTLPLSTSGVPGVTVEEGGALVEDWTANEQSRYLEAASNEPGYDDLLFVDQRIRNGEARTSESVARVFRRFRLNPNWHGRIRDDDGSGSEYFVSPPHDDDGNPVAEWGPDLTLSPEPLWTEGLRFEPRLRLVDRADYSADRIETGAWFVDVPETAAFDFRPPLVVCRSTYSADEFPPAIGFVVNPVEHRYLAGEELDVFAGSVGSAEARGWNLSVDVLEKAPAIDLVVNGKPQHFFARTTFDPALAASFDPEDDPAENGGLQWSEDTRVTLTLEQDSHLVHVEDVVERSLGEPRRDKVIRRPDLRRDYVVPRTVVAVESGQLVHTESGGYVRDDLPRARALAKAAAAWYGVDRAALTLGIGRIDASLSLGQLVTTIGTPGSESERTVNATVHRIVFDFAADTTVIETSFGELDFE